MNARRAATVATMVLAMALLFAACGKGGGSSPGAAAFDALVKKDAITLSDPEKKYLVDIARAAVTGAPSPIDAGMAEGVHAADARAAWVSVTRPKDRALVGFGTGLSVAEAVESAGKNLAKAQGNIVPGRIRIDILDSSDKKRRGKPDKAWKKDHSLTGVAFDISPTLALLPKEIVDFDVMRKNGKFSRGNLKRLLRHRGIDTSVGDNLSGLDAVGYAYFETLQFQEDEDGSIFDLYRGNRLAGFDATPERLDIAIRAAGDYLKNAVDERGKFLYLYLPQYDKPGKGYNLLRHAGTTFAMGQIYEQTRDPELLEAIRRALAFLDRTSDGPDEIDAKTHDWRAVATRGEYAKLGGSGLALLAFSTYTRITGDQQYLPLMHAYGRFIEYMQEPNGDMRQRYWYKARDKGRKVKPVLYYPGEAFFGLSMLYAIDGDERWMNVVEKGIDFIADVRDAEVPTDKLEHDHWMMYAVNQMNKFKPKENHRRHAKRVMEAMMNQFIFESEFPDYVGGYYRRPQTTPAACRLEGSSAIYEMALREGETQYADEIFRQLVIGAGFLMRNQYNEVNTIYFPNANATIGGYQMNFWTPEIQIDFVQHSTSALISTRNAILNREGAKEGEAEEELKPAA
ncbi:hypothetical protein K8I61_01405 [bacterium]|nr:hypothetical protein [bacterium]